MKKVETTIVCDGCGNDISPRDSSYPHQYILRLTYDDIGRNTTGLVYGIATYPPMDREYHFCAEGCIWQWAADRKALAEQRKAELDARSTDMGNGFFIIRSSSAE
jgi:hypothetical protein